MAQPWWVEAFVMVWFVNPSTGVPNPITLVDTAVLVPKEYNKKNLPPAKCIELLNNIVINNQTFGDLLTRLGLENFRDKWPTLIRNPEHVHSHIGCRLMERG
jgi:hypothetical protein